MGADQFFNVTLGKTGLHAFLTVVENAQYDYGHAGYTGTIAEKDSVWLSGGRLPARITTDKFEQILEHYMAFVATGTWVEYKRTPGTTENRRIIRRTDPRPKSLQSIITKKMLAIYDDKWGPAVGVRLNVQEEREMKAWAGKKGTRLQAWLFCGWASS